ncbi:MAG: hypothetical protein KKD77_24295 [Gammaproteobacteria bacterium]|nr:hypothetical protein [Gammaproteobacteria bacterium]
MPQLEAHDDFQKYRIFRRTYWTTLSSKLIRPYWNGKEIEGYILELQSGAQIAVPKQHIKKA